MTQVPTAPPPATSPEYKPHHAAGSPRPPRRRWFLRPWFVGLLGFILGALIIGGTARSTKTVVKTVPGPTVTKNVPGPTGVQKVPGPTVTKKVPVPGPTVTKQVPAPAPAQPASFSDGTYVIGTDIQPGVYKTSGPDSTNIVGSCYWARLASLDTSNINHNNNISGPTTIQLQSGDKALELSGGCNWHKVG